MKHMKSTTSLTIFSTLLIVMVVLILYLMIISNVNSELLKQGIDYQFLFVNQEIIIILLTAVVLAYFISSLIIDRIYNPIWLMIAKVRDIGNMKFAKPLSLSTDDEEMREYAEAFNEMSRKLNSYIERQNRFISDAAHELTTPVTVLNGHTDMLLRWGKEQPELLDNGLEVIKSEAMRMSGLIDSLLLLARSDNGKQKYNFEHVLLSKILNECVAEAQIMAPDFDIELFVDGDIRIYCDEFAMLRVMRILLSNAVRYSGGSKLIRVKADETSGLVDISVKDHGIGIAPEHLPKIFERFYRVDESRSKKTGSSGLGLSIALEIINAHGGSIKADSIHGEGSIFTVTLPV